MQITISPRGRRRTAMALAAVGLGAGLPLAAASPSEAAGLSCGPIKTARVSINYRACAEYIGHHTFDAHTYIQNNHGSPVRVGVHFGWTVNGHTYWDTGYQTLSGDHSWHPYPDVSSELICDPGQRVSYVVQIKENNGDWGPSSTTATWTC